MELRYGVKVIITNPLLSSRKAHCNVQLTFTSIDWSAGLASVVERFCCSQILHIDIFAKHFLNVLFMVGNLGANIRLACVHLRSEPQASLGGYADLCRQQMIFVGLDQLLHIINVRRLWKAFKKVLLPAYGSSSSSVFYIWQKVRF